MNTTIFQYALEVERTRSITQAAENLLIAQPNLSKAIRETVDALERHGLAARAGMVADCGLETEQVYTDLRQLPEEISYFATIVAD